MIAPSGHELREWLDRLAIQDVICRYSDAVTRAAWQQCDRLFSANAVWESPLLGLRFESRAEFLEFLQGTSAYDLLIQTSQASVISLHGTDQATATTTIHELTRGAGLADTQLGGAGAEVNVEQYGIYYDDLARIDGEWKFLHRLFVPIYVNAAGVTGDVFATRSALARPE
jgi:hypothetical protein